MVIDSLTLKISDYDFDNESHLDNRAAIHFISSDYTRTQTLDEKDNGQGWAGVSGGGGDGVGKLHGKGSYSVTILY